VVPGALGLGCRVDELPLGFLQAGHRSNCTERVAADLEPSLVWLGSQYTSAGCCHADLRVLLCMKHVHCMHSCNARQAFSLTTGRCCLQLANLERRAAKGGEPGASPSAARTYYRAAVEQLAAAGGGSLVSVDASLASVDDAVGAAAAAALPERVSSLTRALDSWAQMEFKLGCGWQL
jgi:hypothetical protein